MALPGQDDLHVPGHQPGPEPMTSQPQRHPLRVGAVPLLAPRKGEGGGHVARPVVEKDEAPLGQVARGQDLGLQEAGAVETGMQGDGAKEEALSPSHRLGEHFGLNEGEDVLGKMELQTQAVLGKDTVPRLDPARDQTDESLRRRDLQTHTFL